MPNLTRYNEVKHAFHYLMHQHPRVVCPISCLPVKVTLSHASTQKNQLSAGLYISDDKEKFTMFKEHYKEIEEMIDRKVEWKEASKATRIFTYESYDITNEDQWDEAFDWLLCKALKFKI